MPLIIEDIKQLRELTKDIAIIAGAIAAFTIPTINTNLIQTKTLAYIALLLLFSTIVYSVYHLTEVIPNELTALSKQQKIYSKVVTDNISRINKTFEDGNINHIVDFDQGKVLKEINEASPEDKPDKSLDILRTILFLSLVFIFLSFFKYPVLIW